MSSIRETVSNHVPTGYERYAEPALAALEEREEGIIRELRNVAAEKGLAASEVDSALAEAVRRYENPPVAEEPVAEQSDVAAQLAALTQRFEAAAQLVERRFGVRI